MLQVIQIGMFMAVFVVGVAIGGRVGRAFPRKQGAMPREASGRIPTKWLVVVKDGARMYHAHPGEPEFKDLIRELDMVIR